jgi:hypothetical protein
MTCDVRSITNVWRNFPFVCKAAAHPIGQLSRNPLEIPDFRNWHEGCKAIGIPLHGGDKVQKKQEETMFKSEIGRTLAAIACTLVLSATCVAGAVAPATAGTTATPAMALRLQA